MPVVFRNARERCVHRGRGTFKQLEINIRSANECACDPVALVTASRVAQNSIEKASSKPNGREQYISWIRSMTGIPPRL